MARLATPPSASTPFEWGRRLALLACLVLPLLVLLFLFLNERKPGADLVSWNEVMLSTPPPMPVGDFLREVRASGRFGEQLNLSESGLYEKLLQAVQRHDWVEKATRVALVGQHRIQIDLQFRTPVARLQRGTQVHLVDRFGKILLPLSAEQGSGLISLVGWDGQSNSDTEAMGWLAQAGQLASQLQADLGPWQIASINLVRDGTLDTAELRLKTRSGSSIAWQTLKGNVQEEPPLIEKQSRLRVYHERYGSLDSPAGQMLDVRVKEGLQRRPLQ